MQMKKGEGKMATVLLQVVHNSCDSYAKDLNGAYRLQVS
jgi:hypothetical protein